MLRRVWAQTAATSTWKPKVEEQVYSDGTMHYSYQDDHGRAYNVKDFAEAMGIIRRFKMTEVTEEMYRGGWIAPEVYQEIQRERGLTL